MRRLMWTVMFLGCTLTGAAQGQQGLVRTLERPGKPSVGIEGATINVLEYPNAIVSKKGGKFSFTLDGKRQGDSYTVSRVQKKGYTLVDKQIKGRRYAYSVTVPLEIVMVADQQLENDKKRIEDKAYDKAKKTYNQKVASLEKQLKEKTISEREYREKYEQLSNDFDNYVQLIDQMAERYALTDFKGISEQAAEILQCIENADLERADQLINSKGDFDKREEEIKKKLELKNKTDELSKQLEKDLTAEFDDLAQDYYNKYVINAAYYHNDSAAYYMQRLARLVPTDVNWLRETAFFIMDRISDYPLAEQYFLQALEQARLQYGEQSEQVGEITDKLGLLYDNEMDYDKAIEWHQRAIDILEPIVGTDNQDLAMAYTLIGRAYLSKHDFEKALQYTLKGMEIRERLDINDPQISQSYNNLGVIYSRIGNLEKALEYHLKALDIRLRHYGAEDASSALSYLNIGHVYCEIKDYSRALEYLQLANGIYERIYGPYNPHSSSTYYEIGKTYFSMEDYEHALEWMLKATDSYEKLYGPDNSSTLACRESAAIICVKLGNYAQAIEYYQQVLDQLIKLDTNQETIDRYKDAIDSLKANMKKN